MRRQAGLALLLALAGCAAFPRPFEHQGENPLLQIEEAKGLALALDPQAPEAFGPALIRALGKQEVPSTLAAPRPGAFLLDLRLEEAKLPGGLLVLGFLWEIRDGAGLAVGHHEQRVRVLEALWREGEQAAMRSIAEEAAPSLAKLLLAAENAPVPQPAKPSALRIALEPIDGAPGDGGQSLKTALKAALGILHIEAVEDLADRDVAFVLSARVKVTPAGKGIENVALVWSLFDLEGGEIGQVEQENVIPAGRLNGRWGEVASLAAQGAAEGLADLVRRAKRKK
jgi:hypothetical protein